MVSLITSTKAQKLLANNVRARRLELGLTQAGLSERSGVCLPTLRKFEQKSLISLESFLKLLMALGALDDVQNILRPDKTTFSSIDDVLKEDKQTTRKRGWRK